MKRSKRWLGNGIRVITLVMCALTVFVSVSRAQRPVGGIGGSGPRPPIIQPPKPFVPPIIQPPKPFVPPPIMQPPKPFVPPPIIQPPVLVTEWYCSRCRAVLGQGPFKPNIATCPSCSAKLMGGFTSAPITTNIPNHDPNPIIPPPNPNPFVLPPNPNVPNPIVQPANPPTEPKDNVIVIKENRENNAGSGAFAWWMVAVGVVILLVFGGIAVAIVATSLMGALRSGEKSKKRKSRGRD